MKVVKTLAAAEKTDNQAGNLIYVDVRLQGLCPGDSGQVMLML